jgi:probable F420-dependent oxidoreductase
VTRPLRFAVTPFLDIDSPDEWREQLRRIEDAGISTIVLADHFTEQWTIEPLAGLAAAAMCTSRVRLQTGVLSNDYRHPVLTHRSAALVDVLSDGRLTLGMGAGWLRSDYEGAGLIMDSPGTRLDRLREAILVIKGLFGDEPVHFAGRFYTIDGLVGRPSPVQRPHPPIFVGGGGPRALKLAGSLADIIGVNALLRAGALGPDAVHDLLATRVREKVQWVHEGAARAGRSRDDYELEMNLWLVRVTTTQQEAREFLERVASRYEISPALLAESPSVLVGPIGACADILLERRNAYGITQWQLDAGMSVPDPAVVGELIARLDQG